MTSKLVREATSKSWVMDGASHVERGLMLEQVCTEKHLDTLHPQPLRLDVLWSSWFLNFIYLFVYWLC